MKIIKNKIKSWCRYWHFNVMGVLSDNEGHRNYINVTEILDDWFDTDCWGKDDVTLEESWKVVLSNINKCNDEQILELERYCHSK
jgi:DNA phosphorothioation-dependent restriction protein DptG